VPYWQEVVKNRVFLSNKHDVPASVACQKVNGGEMDTTEGKAAERRMAPAQKATMNWKANELQLGSVAPEWRHGGNRERAMSPEIQNRDP
jgi:hypothetical protein